MVAVSSVSIVSLVVTVGSGLATTLLRLLEHPREYEDKVVKLQKDRWSAAATELGEFLREVEEAVENDELSLTDTDEQRAVDDLPVEARYSYYIQIEHDRDELGTMTEKVERVGEPRAVYEDCRSSYDSATKSFVMALVGGLIASALSVTTVGNEAFGVVVLGATLSAVGIGLLEARSWYRSREQLDEMWEEYQFI